MTQRRLIGNKLIFLISIFVLNGCLGTPRKEKCVPMRMSFATKLIDVQANTRDYQEGNRSTPFNSTALTSINSNSNESTAKGVKDPNQVEQVSSENNKNLRKISNFGNDVDYITKMMGPTANRLNNNISTVSYTPGTVVENETSPGQKNYLAISGGGMYGAFSAGILNGWSAQGNRPVFDVVTGVSTGALIATYAFLGKDYDEKLKYLYTNISKKNIYRERRRISLLWSDSYADSTPLKKLIEANVDYNLLQAVATAHAKGRRLYVGTTNLDTRRFIVWDMGAIASKGDVKSLELYRKILLASSSVPGFFPPVLIDIEINGKPYQELHVDGGVTTEVFIRPQDLGLDVQTIPQGGKKLLGHRLFVIDSGKYYAEPQCVKPYLSSIASGTISALVYAKTRDDLLRLYALCLVTGMSFNSTAVPQGFATSTDSLSFDTKQMSALFDLGFEMGSSNKAWKHLPPGTDPEEQVLPRSGIQFTAPDLDFILEQEMRGKVSGKANYPKTIDNKKTIERLP